MSFSVLSKFILVGFSIFLLAGCQTYIPDYGAMNRHSDSSGKFTLGYQSNVKYSSSVGLRLRRTNYQIFQNVKEDWSSRVFVFVYRCDYQSALYDVVYFPFDGGSTEGGNIATYCDDAPSYYKHFTNGNYAHNSSKIDQYLNEIQKKHRIKEFLATKKNSLKYDWAWLKSERYAADERRRRDAERRRNAEEWDSYRSTMAALHQTNTNMKRSLQEQKTYASSSNSAYDKASFSSYKKNASSAEGSSQGSSKKNKEIWGYVECNYETRQSNGMSLTHIVFGQVFQLVHSSVVYSQHALPQISGRGENPYCHVDLGFDIDRQRASIMRQENINNSRKKTNSKTYDMTFSLPN